MPLVREDELVGAKKMELCLKDWMQLLEHSSVVVGVMQPYLGMWMWRWKNGVFKCVCIGWTNKWMVVIKIPNYC